MSHRHGTTFVTSRKGFSCLTIKIARRNDDIMKIRHGTLSCYVSPITPLAGYAARISPGNTADAVLSSRRQPLGLSHGVK